MADDLKALEAQLAGMRRYRTAEDLKPHKLLMILVVLDLFDAGEARDNKIFYDPGLVERFSTYFNAVARQGDWCQAAPPFFHLRSTGFWKHKPLHGREDEYCRLKTSGGGSKRILDNIDYAFLDDWAFAVVSEPEQRQALRRFIIETFFLPEDQIKIWKVVEEQSRIAVHEAFLESGVMAETTGEVAPAVRNAAFSRVIRRIYDYQCAMCGLRIIGADGSIPVDAAHLIPWRVSRDDSPSNGMALCKLHHWALDVNLVAPTADLKWAVSRLLDRRRNSERELTRFHRLPVLLPKERGNWPRIEAISWRFARLAK